LIVVDLLLLVSIFWILNKERIKSQEFGVSIPLSGTPGDYSQKLESPTPPESSPNYEPFPGSGNGCTQKQARQ
jgi:hypothetical protein